jgi:integration host factor subunit beta
MNRFDLIGHLTARFVQLTQQDTELAVTTILASMSDGLASGRRIEVRDFVVLKVWEQSPKKVRKVSVRTDIVNLI